MTIVTDQRDYTLGEVGRMVEKLATEVAEQRVEARDSRHRLADQINIMIGPVSSLGVRMNTAERNIETILGKVDRVMGKAAFLSGVIAVLGVIAQFFAGWWRR